MHPKSRKGRGGSSNAGNRSVQAGKRHVSSTSSNPVLNHSPPSVTRKSQGRSHSNYSEEQPQGSVQHPTAEQLRSVRPRYESPPPRQQIPVQTPSPQQSHPSQPLQPRTHTRLRTHNEEEEDEEMQNGEEYQDAAAEDEEEAEGEDEHAVEEVQHEGGGSASSMTLHALLTTPGRDDYLKKLSPYPEEGIWFKGEEGEELTAKIAKIIQEKFDGPWYSWTVTPPDIQDRYFTELAHRYTWDPIITPLVRDKFNEVCKSRMKGMVNYAKGTGKRPNWIRDTLWKQMENHWATEEFIKKSKNASSARMSDRGGLGVHKHCSGPKSHDSIHEKMEKEEGRPVSVGEVFIKTHTSKDGTFIDAKAKQVHDSYQQKLDATLSEIAASGTSDGASNTQQLTLEQRNAIFMESTVINSRGTPYGIGRLARLHSKGKKPLRIENKSQAMMELEEKLKDAQQQIEEQARYNKLMFEYLKNKDPNLPQWLEGNHNPTSSASTPP